ncbi:MAG: glycosyltransferase family 39 protein [Candidatus Eisenbacteria bacterium]
MRGAGGAEVESRFSGGRGLLLLLALLLLLRLLTLGRLPLFDVTESRYAEIGREMAVTGDWITPTLHGGEPFLAKPPLHLWITAASIRAFGANEWAARLPGFLAAIGTLAIVAAVGRALFGAEASRLAVLLLGTSGLFYLLSGAVVLDGTFTLTTTGAIGSFLLHRRDPTRRVHGLLVFLFLGLGLLAKGPAAAVLVLLAIGAGSAARRSAAGLRALPWLPGIGIGLAVAGPWYLLAERATPGFWNYFFIHEHLLRYLRREYGDLYGHGHVSPYGLVWVLGFLAFLPWTPGLVGAARRAWCGRGTAVTDPSVPFLWSGALVPLVFFTLSRSLSLPYVLPSLPFLALLLGREWAVGEGRVIRWPLLLTPVLFLGGSIFALYEFPSSTIEKAALLVLSAGLALAALVAARSGSRGVLLGAGAVLFPAFLLGATFALPRSVGEAKSTRHLAEAVARIPGDGEREVLFHGGVPLSAEFYFGGRVSGFDPGKEAGAGGESGGDLILVLRGGREEELPPEIGARLSLAGTSGRHRIYILPAASSPAGAGKEGAR